MNFFGYEEADPLKVEIVKYLADDRNCLHMMNDYSTLNKDFC